MYAIDNDQRLLRGSITTEYISHNQKGTF